MPRDELVAYLRSHPTVSLHPFTSRALGAGRSLAYCLAGNESIPTLRLGHLLKVRSAWLEQTLFGEQGSPPDC
jgi:hypothetical protein